MREISVEMRDVLKRHGSTVAVDHLSLEVHRGEFFSLLGPSGSGKTTTLRLLAGFEAPDEGTIHIEGCAMEGVPPNERPVNLVFQHYALFPHLTVFDNIAFGLGMRRVPKAEITGRVDRMLAMVKLSGKGPRLPSHLSGGEQQRVALARALVNQPAVLLLDEPLGALDQSLRQEMQGELKGLQERTGITFLCVTHHQEEALTMSDRVAVMDHGRLLQVGTPQEIYESPASTFVAGFIGLSNQARGRVIGLHGSECSIRLESAPDAPVIRARRPAILPVDSRVTLMLRPERVHLSSTAGATARLNEAPGRVDKVIYNGNETQYDVQVFNALLWRVRVVNAAADQKLFQVGQGVYLRWPVDEGIVLTA